MTYQDDMYVRARLRDLDDHHEAVAEAMAADVDRVRDEWAQSYGDMRSAHEKRMAEIAQAHRSWMTAHIAHMNGEEPQEDTDVDQGPPTDAPAARAPSSPAGSGPGQPLLDDELEQAMALRNMTMAEYAASRRDLGIRGPGVSGLFR